MSIFTLKSDCSWLIVAPPLPTMRPTFVGSISSCSVYSSPPSPSWSAGNTQTKRWQWESRSMLQKFSLVTFRLTETRLFFPIRAICGCFGVWARLIIPSWDSSSSGRLCRQRRHWNFIPVVRHRWISIEIKKNNPQKMRFNCLGKFREILNGKSAEKFTIFLAKSGFNCRYELKTRLRSLNWIFLPALLGQIWKTLQTLIDCQKFVEIFCARTSLLVSRWAVRTWMMRSKLSHFVDGAFLCSLAVSRLSLDACENLRRERMNLKIFISTIFTTFYAFLLLLSFSDPMQLMCNYADCFYLWILLLYFSYYMYDDRSSSYDSLDW